jgi:ubiquinone/menaquinone biosynthesis C-methylase UbiE
MDYNDYIKLQTETALSHEEDKKKWAEGQRIFVRKIIKDIKKTDLILDCACGDGVGLEELRSLGYTAIGADLADPKLERAKNKNLNVFKSDMHDLSNFSDDQFDVIICSHTLEHAYDPNKVIKNFRRILKNDGLLFIVLPFPDLSDNADVHIAKDFLGTSDRVNGETKIQNFFKQSNFEIFEKSFDNFREPEIHLSMKKISSSGDQ